MRLGLLTGGGDCPGLNAAIRAVVRTAYHYGHEVIGFKRGWKGPIENLVEPLDMDKVSEILHIGGTILGSSRTNPAKVPNGYERIIENLKANNVDVLIVIGGEDTLSVAAELYKRGIKTVGIPKTIDNDVYGTDYCIGFHTAVHIVTEALDRLHTTASSHHRVIVVEVMGRTAGWIALYGGLAGGADWILIPELKPDLEQMYAHLKRRRELGKHYSIVVVAEGVEIPEIEKEFKVEEKDVFGHVRLEKKGIGMRLADMIQKATGFESRHVVLGHLQRGGTPTHFDRLLGTWFGIKAVEAIEEGKFGKMVAIHGTDIVLVDIVHAMENSPRLVTEEMWERVKILF